MDNGKRRGDENNRRLKKSKPYVSSSDSEEECEDKSTNNLADSPLMNPRVILTPSAPKPSATTLATTPAARQKGMPKPSTNSQASPSKAASTNSQASPSKATPTSNARAGPSSAPDRSSQPYALRHGVASFAGHGWVSLRDDRIRVYGRRIQREVEFRVWEFMRNLAHHHPDADIDIDFDERAVVVRGGTAEMQTINALLGAILFKK